MTGTTVPARGTAVSLYEFDAASAGTYSLVNISCNYNNKEILICDKMELAVPDTSHLSLMPVPPRADFTADPLFGTAPLAVRFADTSSGNLITSWQWDFDNDGTIDSTERNPVRTTYSSPGNHTVRLVVSGAEGNGEVTKENLIAVAASDSLILADFGDSEAGNLYELSDWTIPIKDTYTNYRGIGPGGTTITIGSNGSYDYQGIRGSATEFREGDKILVTWYDNSDAPVAFTPKISFDDPNRPGASYAPVGTWYDMTGTTVPARGTAVSLYEFDAASAGTYSLVNISCNYDNKEILICDKIELTENSSGNVPVIHISAEPESILPGSSSVLTWGSGNADSVSIDQGIGTVDPQGSVTVTPTQTTTYTITA